MVNIFKIFGENKVKRFFNRIAVGWRESNFYFRRGTPSVIENAEGFFRQLPRGRSLLPGDPLRVAVMFTMWLHACERAYANQPPFDREVASLRAGGSSFFKAKVTLPMESHKDSFVDLGTLCRFCIGSLRLIVMMPSKVQGSLSKTSLRSG